MSPASAALPASSGWPWLTAPRCRRLSSEVWPLSAAVSLYVPAGRQWLPTFRPNQSPGQSIHMASTATSEKPEKRERKERGKWGIERRTGDQQPRSDWFPR